MAMLHRIGMAVLVGMCMGAEPAMAQPLLLGGTQLAPENSYSYLGAIMPFAGGRLGSGWFGTVFSNYLTYNYNYDYGGLISKLPPTLAQAIFKELGTTNPLARVQVSAPGIQGGIGYAWQGSDYQLALSGALGYQYFLVSIHTLGKTVSLDETIPVSPTTPKQIYLSTGGPLGGTVSFTPQVQAHYDFTPVLYVSTMASYSFGQRAYWSRFRGGIRPLSWLSFGPEGVLQGGVNYRIHQVGVFISVALGDGWSVEGEGGINYTSGLPSTGYGGLSFAKVL